MRIVGLGFDQAKSFSRPQSVDLAELNLVYGANSAGKSSVFQVLALLMQSTGRAYRTDPGRLEFRGSAVDLGGYRTFIANHDERAVLEIALHLQASHSGEYAGYFGDEVHLRLQFGLRDELHEATLVGLDILDDSGQGVRASWCDESGALRFQDADSAHWLAQKFVDVLDELPRRIREELGEITEKDQRWLRDWIRRSDLELSGWIPHWDNLIVGRGKRGRPYGGTLGSLRGRLLDYLVSSWSAWASNFSFELLQCLDATVYVGPLREFPKRVATEAVDPRGVGVRGERLVLHLSRHPELIDRVNDAFRVLEVPYELVVERLSAEHGQDALGDVAVAVLNDLRSGVAVSPLDVGFGLSQILPVVVQVLANEDRLILVEQPEIHLHPKMQSRLADLLIQSCIEHGNRLVVETHSEHLLFRAQRRIREQSVSGFTSGSMNVFYVTHSQGSSSVTQLDLAPNGDLLSAWPDGFFDDRIEDLFAPVEI